MRDPKRIPRILGKIEEVWKKRPDLRLGQLIHNYASINYDMFYLEDHVLEISLDNIIREDVLQELTELGQEMEKDYTNGKN